VRAGRPAVSAVVRVLAGVVRVGSMALVLGFAGVVLCVRRPFAREEPVHVHHGLGRVSVFVSSSARQRRQTDSGVRVSPVADPGGQRLPGPVDAHVFHVDVDAGCDFENTGSQHGAASSKIPVCGGVHEAATERVAGSHGTRHVFAVCASMSFDGNEVCRGGRASGKY